jgi:hypothetical protein
MVLSEPVDSGLSSEEYHTLLEEVETVIAGLLSIPIGDVNVGMEADAQTLIVEVTANDVGQITDLLTSAYTSGDLEFANLRVARLVVESKSIDDGVPIHTIPAVGDEAEYDTDTEARERILWLSAVLPMSVLVIFSVAMNFVFVSHYGSLVKGAFRVVDERASTTMSIL